MVLGVDVVKHGHGFRVRHVDAGVPKLGGHSVSFRNGHASVRIDQETYNQLRANLTELSVRRSVEALVAEFQSLPFEPYAPVRRQLLNLLRTTNRIRVQAGFEPVPASYLQLRRRVVQPFGAE